MSGKRAFSVLGIFESAQLLMKAIPEVKNQVTGRLEAYTPYPIHGMDKALGLRKSPVGGMVLVMGVIGAVAAMAFELWTSGVDYPQMTAGKPFLSWEAFVPIMFEVTVLFACFTSGLGMLLLLNRLPMFRHPMLRAASMPLLTRDQFGLAVESGGNEMDVERITALLRKSGAKSVEVIDEPEATGPVSPRFLLAVVLAIGLSCAAAGYLTYWATKLFPVSIPVVHMLKQPRLEPQSESAFFKDGFGMRMPVPDTVMRGSVRYAIRKQEDAGSLANPLPRSQSVLNQGRQAFVNYCSVCHGALGDGVPTLTAAYGAKPANLVSQKMIEMPDGQIYHVLVMGKNAMPSYSAEMNDPERWAAVHYVRALQRALNARDEDIPK